MIASGTAAFGSDLRQVVGSVDGVARCAPRSRASARSVATRASSRRPSSSSSPTERPDVVGGSADLAPSNNTLIADVDTTSRLSDPRRAQYVRFGIREHAMGAILNGTQSARRTCAGSAGRSSRSPTTCGRRCAWRRSWSTPSVYVWTHDSIFLGEDGPTHQSDRAPRRASGRFPGLDVVAASSDPCRDGRGVAGTPINRTDGPTALDPHAPGPGNPRLVSPIGDAVASVAGMSRRATATMSCCDRCHPVPRYRSPKTAADTPGGPRVHLGAGRLRSLASNSSTAQTD